MWNSISEEYAWRVLKLALVIDTDIALRLNSFIYLEMNGGIAPSLCTCLHILAGMDEGDLDHPSRILVATLNEYIFDALSVRDILLLNSWLGSRFVLLDEFSQIRHIGCFEQGSY